MFALPRIVNLIALFLAMIQMACCPTAYEDGACRRPLTDSHKRNVFFNKLKAI